MPLHNSAAEKLAVCATAALIIAGASHPAAASKFKTIHSFCRLSNGCKDGGDPAGPLVQDGNGVFYGTTYEGGKHGGGVVFALTPDGGKYDYSILYNFCSKKDCGDGTTPNGYLILDSSGNLYRRVPCSG